jgi:hypothetical protein
VQIAFGVSAHELAVLGESHIAFNDAGALTRGRFV